MLCDEQFNISLLYFILVQSVVFYVKDIAWTSTSLIVSAVKMTELKLVKILKLQSSIICAEFKSKLVQKPHRAINKSRGQWCG